MADGDKDRDEGRWRALVERWDEQQERYLPGREERFAFMIDLIGLGGNAAPRVLDLCCGPGALGARVLDRFPEASVVGVDFDPAHLELGRRTLGDRVEWRDVDLRGDEWAEAFVPGSFDAIVSATAIHWFRAEEIVRLYRALALLLRDGGLFVNADHLPVDSPQVSAMSASLLERWQAPRLAGGEDYAAYREALRAETELRPFVEEGDRRLDIRTHGVSLPMAFHVEALRIAGFREVGDAWRRYTDAVLVAIR